MSAPRDDGPVAGSLLQLHIPKTAGRTLHALLERHFDATDVLPVLLDSRAADDPPTGGSAMTRLKTRVLHRLGDSRRVAPQLSRYRFVVAHDDLDVSRAMQPPVAVVTLFRDPVARTHSLFRHALRHPHHPLHHASARGGLPAFAEAADGHPRFTDRQCRQLVGERGGAVDVDELAARAMEMLDREWFVYGVVERLDRSLERIGAALGLDLADGPAPRLNTAPEGARQLTDDESALLCTLNRADQVLYDRALAEIDAGGRTTGVAIGPGQALGPVVKGASRSARPAGWRRRASSAAAKVTYALRASVARQPEGTPDTSLSTLTQIATGDSGMRDGEAANGSS